VRTIIVFSGSMRGPCLLLVLAATVACSRPGIDVEFYTSDGYRFTASEKRAVERIARRTAIEVRRLLPALASDLVLRVEAGSRVIPETGETGSAGGATVVTWTVNPADNRGVRAIVNTQLRATLFHEFHHLVRQSTIAPTEGLVDAMITEGLATAFERDFAGARPPWGAYPDDVSAWVNEVLALPPGAPTRQWMFQHPDGRRWIGYKVGTYLADRAIRASGRSAAELVSTPAEDILRLALTPEGQ
jgi:hypothetical protein